MMRFRLLTAVAAPALMIACATPAQAQDDAAQDDTPEVVVTAQGRAQALSDVPLSVSAVDAESLELSGANDIRQLNQLAPSLLVSSTGSEANGSARIRGIGTVGDNPGLESSVAVFIDGVYRSRSGIGLNELGEIERVEVLRGPQGTLFGRNASAGIIHIISKAPSSTFGANGELTYGNYNQIRASGGITGPIGDTISARLDGVYVKRDGFYEDPANNTRVNNRDRYFIRGQLLFEPSSDLTVRIIGDYTKRDESCCGAIYVDNSVNANVGNLNNLATPITTGSLPPASGNNIINVLTALGQPLARFTPGYDRTISVTPGRSYAGTTEDKGISAQIDYDFGGATLTSITAYRDYRSSQAGDLDYSQADILYRGVNDDAYRGFKTFSQEVRLQGEAFDGGIDWLIGGFYADEDLSLTDNTRFGNQYGRFASCRLVSGGGLAALYSPTSAGCLAARPAAFGALSPLIYSTIDNLDSINNKGSTLDRYNQNSRNFALFTHNIFHVTDKFDVTVGLRYTSERKKLNATFGNDNTACLANQNALAPFFNPASPTFQPALFGVMNSIIGLSCTGNSTSELNGVSINSQREEDQITGTTILSFRPTEDWMIYGSFSRGYKAGGFNLDRSALKAPSATFASVGGAQAVARNLQFDPEIVHAYEVGAKYQRGRLGFSLALFRQEFKNFQLNTFDGTVFIVQNVNGCSDDLGGADRDQSIRIGAANFVAPVIAGGAAFNLNPAAATGRCAQEDVTWGVKSQGVEFEASYRPTNDLALTAGITYADTSYRGNLVGDYRGTPLNPALRKLPGEELSNAPDLVGTASIGWTPSLGESGLSGLIYFDARATSDYNTGSDLFPQKHQEHYALFNGRIGVRGPDEKWAIEFWGQNIFNKDYAQVAFNSPFQEGGTGVPGSFPASGTAAPFIDPQYPGGRQIMSMFLAEPRTYGITGRFRF
jgi:iron complex outermembrane receptor protein